MAGLTVAEVAGIVALSTAIVGFLGPNLIALLIAAFVGRQRSAVTWSVVGRELQSSNWPLFLRTDASSSTKIPRSIGLLCWLQQLAWILITVAGIITPLGLRSDIQLDPKTSVVKFQPISDKGPMGRGTPPRDADAFFNRMCFGNGYAPPLVGCPFSDTKVEIIGKNETTTTYHFDGSYDVRIPHTTAEIFSSLHDEHDQSVSGAFDIQWRHYTYKSNKDLGVSVNNREKIQVGIYRSLDSLILDEAIEPIDGLIVDTRNGGIALRNHTGPAETEIGGEWEEELLFVSPQTVCVDTNLTYDFQIVDPGQFLDFGLSSGLVMNLSLTDRGGFININRTNPWPVEASIEAMASDGQDHLELRFRAYVGAWFNNVLSMFYYNVSNPSVGKYEFAFNYTNSHLGKSFYLDPSRTSTAGPKLLQLSPRYGSYVSSSSYFSTNGSFVREKPSKFDDPRTVYDNPWRITSDNFTDVNVFCSRAGGADRANITNVGVACGLMFGAATLSDGQHSLVFTPGTWWTQPIYSCATGLRAGVKRVTFSWNASAEDTNPLSRLKVQRIEDKTYKLAADEPYWAVENLHRDISNSNPLWGLVSSETAKLYQDNRFINISHSSRLFLPGSPVGTDYLASDWFTEDSNLAAADAFMDGLKHTYAVDETSLYTGASSMALYQKWQELSETAETASKIPNLIWTDIIANALIGTRSTLSDNSLPHNIQPKLSPGSDPHNKRDSGSGTPSSSAEIPIRLYRNRITYRWLYAVPAMLSLALIVILLLVSLGLSILGQMAGPSTLRTLLSWTSAGRLLAMLKDHGMAVRLDEISSNHGDLSDDQSGVQQSKDGALLSAQERHPMSLSSSEWIEMEGVRMIDLDAIRGTSSDSRPSSR